MAHMHCCNEVAWLTVKSGLSYRLLGILDRASDDAEYVAWPASARMLDTDAGKMAPAFFRRLATLVTILGAEAERLAGGRTEAAFAEIAVIDVSDIEATPAGKRRG